MKPSNSRREERKPLEIGGNLGCVLIILICVVCYTLLVALAIIYAKN